MSTAAASRARGEGDSAYGSDPGTGRPMARGPGRLPARPPVKATAAPSTRSHPAASRDDISATATGTASQRRELDFRSDNSYYAREGGDRRYSSENKNAYRDRADYLPYDDQSYRSRRGGDTDHYAPERRARPDSHDRHHHDRTRQGAGVPNYGQSYSQGYSQGYGEHTFYSPEFLASQRAGDYTDYGRNSYGGNGYGSRGYERAPTAPMHENLAAAQQDYRPASGEHRDYSAREYGGRFA